VSAPVTIGRATLYLGDCRSLLRGMGKADALVTDPPYGIGADKGAGKSAEKWSAFTGSATWDDAPLSEGDIDLLLGAGRHCIIWGGNYFPLPPSNCWLIWDKETAGVTTFADAEVAWTNLDKAMRLKRHLWSGPYMKIREERHHPTQKPLAIMQWCIDQLPAKVSSVVDPFLGSGTTGVAAVMAGKDFVGIEQDARYFDIACKRIEQAQRQGDFFVRAA
jgi:site-specific DNA-methyltransferase (adenine-specific)/modification methylase